MNTRLSLAAAGLLTLAGIGMAAAQDVVITPDQETVIHQYITTQKVEPVAPPADFEVTVGAVVPDTVQITPLDVPDMQTKYDYVVLGDRTVLVDPGSRKIVHIMQ
jgi:hypothetical protein